MLLLEALRWHYPPGGKKDKICFRSNALLQMHKILKTHKMLTYGVRALVLGMCAAVVQAAN